MGFDGVILNKIEWVHLYRHGKIIYIYFFLILVLFCKNKWGH
jgi:hypothetical protein